MAQLYEDNELYCQMFFPKTCRQKSAGFHKRMDNALWAGRRHVAIKVFRSGAKTTRLRIFLSKRIAYGVSRTILYISKSEEKAEATLLWLKNQVDRGTQWAQFYGISQGSEWSATKAVFHNSVLNIDITVVVAGIHGQIRGLNFDDFRPDCIVCDDIDDEKTTNTAEQVQKYSDLFWGTIVRSLASPVDNPLAMICIIQTPLVMDDTVETAFKNAGPGEHDWLCVEASCFETDSDGNLCSAWPDLWPLDWLLAQKQEAIKINKLSLWLKEMEVTVTSPEECSFKPEWLVKHKTLPDVVWDELIITVDPASSDTKEADYHCTSLSGKIGIQAWLIAYHQCRGIDIEESVKQFFDAWDLMLVLAAKSRKTNLRFGVEIVGYQRQFKRAIEKEMRRRKRLAYIEPIQDKRAKEDVINQSFTHVAANKCYNCLEGHTEFIEQFNRYPKVPHDDLIETAARALDMMDLTGTAGTIAQGNVARVAATPALIKHSAQRLITGRGLSLGRFSRHHNGPQ